MLTACDASTADRLAAQAAAARSRPVQARVDSKLTDPCADPQLLPERELTAAEVEHTWRVDRANLVFCKAKHGGVIRVYRAREAVFTGRAAK
jgi:hypothetical protein